MDDPKCGLTIKSLTPLERLLKASTSRVVAVLLALCFCCVCLLGQSAFRLNELDQQISQAQYQELTQSGTLIVDNDTSALLKRIGSRIAHTSYFAGYPFQTEIFYIQDQDPNAFSTGGGRVYVCSGLVGAVQRNEGVLAFAISHEMAHNRLQHAVRDYLRRVQYETEYRRLRAQNPRAALAFQIAWWITEKKIERDQEHAADALGLLAAAAAGYHPDYAVLAARVLRLQNPDRSKLMTFFSSNHPRWITREEHTNRNYAAALAIFRANWPNVELSPGGIPPTLAIVSPVRVSKDKLRITATASIQIHNLNGRTAVLTAQLSEAGRPPQLAFEKQYSGDYTEADPVSFAIARTQVKSPKKTSLILRLTAGNNVLYESEPINLGSSHKSNRESKAVGSSTGHAAEQSIAEVRPDGNQQKPVEIIRNDQPDIGPETAGVLTGGNANVSRRAESAGSGASRQQSYGSEMIGTSQLTSVSSGSAKAPEICEVEVKSNPPDATVEFDGIPVGKTPAVFRVNANGFGFNIEVKKKGYHTWLTQTFSTGGRQTFEADLNADTSVDAQNALATH